MGAVKKENVILSDLVVEYIDCERIKPNIYNPNRQSEQEFELLCRSMEEDGFTQPCVVRRSDMMIVDGEHRWRAAQSLGMETIPVVFTEMTDAQMRISTLRHNRARGEEDLQLSAAVLKDLSKLGDLDAIQDSLMLTDEEITLMTNVPDPEYLNEPEFEEARTPQMDGGGGMVPRELVVESSAAASDAARAERDEVNKRRNSQEMEIETQQRVSTLRISLVYLNEEAKLVRAACGKNLAEGVLALCVDAYQAQQKVN